MLKKDVPNFAKSVLKHILQRHGEVLYSSHETIAPGDVYLLGLNPGGKGFITIEAHIDQMLNRTHNSYIDEEWENGNGHWSAGEAPLQRRVIWLLKSLEFDPRMVCASNLIFQTSSNADGISFGLAGLCWPFHEAMIEIVRPRLLLVFGNGAGNSPYAFIKALFAHSAVEDVIDAGHGDWKCKGFGTAINNHSIYVVGLPHLSLYDPARNPDVVKWIKTKY